MFQKITTLFTALVNYSAGARYTKWIANLVPNVLSLALCNIFFFGCYSLFQIPAPSADNKWGGKLLSSLDRVAFVIAKIIYSSSPPLFLAPRFWELSDHPHPGFFLEVRERTLEIKEPGHCENKKEPSCIVVWSVAEKIIYIKFSRAESGGGEGDCSHLPILSYRRNTIEKPLPTSHLFHIKFTSSSSYFCNDSSPRKQWGHSGRGQLEKLP